jgi:hypothetical protein
LHRLEVRAPGRKTEARMVPLDRDLTLHLELPVLPSTPAAVAPPPKAIPRPGSAPSAPADDFVHKPRDGKPARAIDNSDPYGP